MNQTTAPSQTDEHTDFIAISPRPLGQGVASAFISAKGGKHYAHAITHHNFQKAVPSEYGATSFRMAEYIDRYLTQREHVIEAAIANWHGDKATVRTLDTYGHDEWANCYEFNVEIQADPTEGNAILALLDVDPGYLPDDPDFDVHMAEALREYDQNALANPDDLQVMPEMVFTAHFLGLFQQEAEDTFRSTQGLDPTAVIEFDRSTHEYLVRIARGFYRTYEGDILAWQNATEYSLAEFAYQVVAGKRSSLPSVQACDLPSSRNYTLEERVIAVRLDAI